MRNSALSSQKFCFVNYVGLGRSGAAAGGSPMKAKGSLLETAGSSSGTVARSLLADGAYI